MYGLNDYLQSCPESLVERIRPVGIQGIRPEGEMVLYWMRTAIRTDENQALSVAIDLANYLNRPVLVYQGLSERYPYASDRHHTFILQGAYEVQQELKTRGIGYALNVERCGEHAPHLRTLGLRAAAVITEEMPCEPLRGWTVALQRSLPCPVLAVDTACIVPMQIVGKCYERAFEYRDATRKLCADRLPLRVPEYEATVASPSTMQIPFESVDLQEIDIAKLVRQCNIDHSIGPVTHTRGGSSLGYQRWQNFKSSRLSHYDRLRNNPLVDGVSKLSPYLHYGMIAPTKIAREADEENSKGAAKFLDELLIWRELAYVFCRYRQDHNRLSAIPSWARFTLQEHERDDRNVLSWETLARGRTGDLLWDSAQRSLLIHGELHNNVRMTWGKSILNWTPNAKEALACMIDLNHRYALDGRDPASYGGLLWCLGQFDRPFSPAQPVFGKVRLRSTEMHAKRLDPHHFRRKVTRPLWENVPKVAVIGAGISGLICARTLSDHGCDVTVFEKSRGVGGRLSTRRAEHGLHFDHGAQYFTVRDQRFKRYVDSWIDDGIVKRWEGRIALLERGKRDSERENSFRYVALPGMNALGKHIAKELNLKREEKIVEPRRSGDQWLLFNEKQAPLGRFDVVVVAVPSQQAAPLLAGSPLLSSRSKSVLMRGCLALMLAFKQSLDLDFEGAFVRDSPISWIAQNCSKPERICDGESWVVHAESEWSDIHMDDRPDQIRKELLHEFFSVVQRKEANPFHCDLQRWRYAIPENPLAQRCLYDEERRIGACGDWCGGPRVEGAFLSGMAIAGRILGELNVPQSDNSKNEQQLTLFD